MLTAFDYAVIAFANEYNLPTEIVYKRCEKDPYYKGYRHKHTEEELIAMLARSKEIILRLDKK